nr:coiled-coil domain-containing protein 86-like [Aegilops tauschii subsp. strangulata]
MAPVGIAVISLGTPKQGFLPTPDHESQSPLELLEQADHPSGMRAHLVAQYPPSPHEPDQAKGDTALPISIPQPQHHLHRAHRTPPPPLRPPDTTTTTDVPDVMEETKHGTDPRPPHRAATPDHAGRQTGPTRSGPCPDPPCSRTSGLPQPRRWRDPPSARPPTGAQATTTRSKWIWASHHHPQQMDMGRESPRCAAIGFHGRPHVALAAVKAQPRRDPLGPPPQRPNSTRAPSSHSEQDHAALPPACTTCTRPHRAAHAPCICAVGRLLDPDE